MVKAALSLLLVVCMVGPLLTVYMVRRLLGPKPAGAAPALKEQKVKS